MTWLATWSNVEITVGIIIACLPAARLLVLRYLPGKISSWHHTSHTPHTSRSNHTPRSSKLGSTATWVSGLSALSGKRESTAQPSVPLSDGSHFDKDRDCSTQVAVSSPGGFNSDNNNINNNNNAASGSGTAAGPGRRDSELPLVPGFDAHPPAAASQASVPDEPPPNPIPIVKDRRIWVEQHIYVSSDPLVGEPTSISRGDDESPKSLKFPGIEDV